VLLGVALLAGLVLLLRGDAMAGGKGKAGTRATAFESVDENGKPWKSSDHIGKKIVVLCFYSGDFTTACTSQTCGFRDNIEALGKNVEVIGISADSIKTHALFKKHHKLPFTLLADVKGDVATAFGVPVTVGRKKGTGIDDGGKKVNIVRDNTIARYTVVIDQNGVIVANDYVGNKFAEDAQRVNELIKKLEKK
jgi:peroxiredoxin Q/BCP